MAFDSIYTGEQLESAIQAYVEGLLSLSVLSGEVAKASGAFNGVYTQINVTPTTISLKDNDQLSFKNPGTGITYLFYINSPGVDLPAGSEVLPIDNGAGAGASIVTPDQTPLIFTGLSAINRFDPIYSQFSAVNSSISLLNNGVLLSASSGAIAVLSGSLTSGSPVATLPVAPTYFPLASGDQIFIIDRTSFSPVVAYVTAPVVKGSTSIPVSASSNSQVSVAVNATSGDPISYNGYTFFSKLSLLQDSVSFSVSSNLVRDAFTLITSEVNSTEFQVEGLRFTVYPGDYIYFVDSVTGVVSYNQIDPNWDEEDPSSLLLVTPASLSPGTPVYLDAKYSRAELKVTSDTLTSAIERVSNNQAICSTSISYSGNTSVLAVTATTAAIYQGDQIIVINKSTAAAVSAVVGGTTGQEFPIGTTSIPLANSVALTAPAGSGVELKTAGLRSIIAQSAAQIELKVSSADITTSLTVGLGNITVASGVLRSDSWNGTLSGYNITGFSSADNSWAIAGSGQFEFRINANNYFRYDGSSLRFQGDFYVNGTLLISGSTGLTEGSITSASLADGAVVASKLSQASRDFMLQPSSGNTIFSSTGPGAISWTQFSVKFKEGDTRTVSSGTLTGMTAGQYRYLYINIAGGGTLTLQNSALLTTFDTSTNVLIGVTYYSSTSAVIIPVGANPVIDAASIKVVNLSALSADLGAATAGSIVIGTTNRIWLNDGDDGSLAIGGSNKASANFRVSNTGILTATSANITGAITATSGSFTGSVTATTGSITGTLTMGVNGIITDSGANYQVKNTGIYLMPRTSIFSTSEDRALKFYNQASEVEAYLGYTHDSGNSTKVLVLQSLFALNIAALDNLSISAGSGAGEHLSLFGNEVRLSGTTNIINTTLRLNGFSTSTGVGATGAASLLPQRPVGYLIINIDGTNRKVPYYNV